MKTYYYGEMTFTRIPRHVKDKLKKVCKRRGSSVTAELARMIGEFLEQDRLERSQRKERRSESGMKRQRTRSCDAAA